MEGEREQKREGCLISASWTGVGPWKGRGELEGCLISLGDCVSVEGKEGALLDIGRLDGCHFARGRVGGLLESIEQTRDPTCLGNGSGEDRRRLAGPLRLVAKVDEVGVLEPLN